MRARGTLFATIAVVAFAGCEDLGLPDRNLPHEDAAHRPPDALVQAVHPGTRPADATAATPGDAAHGATMSSNAVRIGEQTFMPSGVPTDMDPAMLAQVGAGSGMSFHALRSDEAPYDRVFMTHPGGQYIAYLPVHDEGDPAARAATQHEGLSGGGAAAH